MKLSRILLAAMVLFAAASAQARTLDEIKKDGKIVMATEGAFPPFNLFRGPTLTGFEVDRAGAFHGPGQLFQLRRKRLQLGGQGLGIDVTDFLGGFEQAFQHHRDARQDRFFDPVERLFKACLLLFYAHERLNTRACVKPW